MQQMVEVPVIDPGAVTHHIKFNTYQTYGWDSREGRNEEMKLWYCKINMTTIWETIIHDYGN